MFICFFLSLTRQKNYNLEVRIRIAKTVLGFKNLEKISTVLQVVFNLWKGKQRGKYWKWLSNIWWRECMGIRMVKNYYTKPLFNIHFSQHSNFALPLSEISASRTASWLLLVVDSQILLKTSSRWECRLTTRIKRECVLWQYCSCIFVLMAVGCV